MEELAVRMLLDYDAHRPGTLFADPAFEITLDQAYDLQFAVVRLRQMRGEVLAGYKIGCVSRSVQEQLGTDRPVFGHVWAGEVHLSGSELRLDSFASLAIEGEVAVSLGPDGRTIVGVFPVIELHNRVFRRPPSAVELVANNAIHAGIVKPRESTPPSLADDLTISVFRDGVLLGSAPGAVFPGGFSEAVDHVARHLDRRGLRLLPSQVVLTGTPLPLFDVLPSQRIRVVASNGQEVAATFV
jgi:2-keto-4-pentenoate hydratase